MKAARKSHSLDVGTGILRFGIVVIGHVFFTSGCREDCEKALTCPVLSAGGSGGGTTGSGGADGAPPDCIPSNMSVPIGNECGVFVSASTGNDGNAGSKEAPLATIGKALGAAKGKPIYLCAETFVEAVAVGGGALVFGGLDCAAEWLYSGPEKPTELTAGAGEIPLHVGGSNSIGIHDVVIRAADGGLPGQSSIAIVAESQAQVDLVRCSVEAGQGANGKDGDGLAGAAGAGQQGAPGAMACTASVVDGADGPIHQCDKIDSVGGFGGLGADGSAGNGTSGEPFASANLGAGEKLMKLCLDGTTGSAGAGGPAGEGGMSAGGIGPAGFIGSAGKDGQAGKVGQGGGGGGGARGGGAAAQCPAWNLAAGNGGASGGSGGSGGCGGKGGKGGMAAGASIAIVSLDAKLTFTDVKIVARSGGNGGNGGAGQPGGAGAPGGAGGTVPGGVSLAPACAGGNGGNGGAGGRGGGGRGGHSIGIAYTGEAPGADGVTVTLGVPGAGGAGEGVAGTGADGAATSIQGFL